jgi:predicted transcriptional regulator
VQTRKTTAVRMDDHLLDYEKWFIAEVKRGLVEIEIEDLISHEEVVTAWKLKRESRVVPHH